MKAIDEFHVGGLQATNNILKKLNISSNAKVLDIGSGLGGTARHITLQTGARVTGIDLSPEFIFAAKRLCKMTKIDVKFILGNALELPFKYCQFDFVTLIHVGMNISNKTKLFNEVYRVLKSNRTFALYDIMKVGNGDYIYPLPWANNKLISFVEYPNVYINAAEKAGFALFSKEIKDKFALSYFKNLKPISNSNKLPKVGLNLVMGNNFEKKVKNLITAIKDKHLAPIEMIFKKCA